MEGRNGWVDGMKGWMEGYNGWNGWKGSMEGKDGWREARHHPWPDPSLCQLAGVLILHFVWPIQTYLDLEIQSTLTD